MSRKTGNAESRATFFRHSAVLSLPAVLLRKVPNDTSDVNYGVIPSTVHFLYESIKTDSICVAHVTIDLSTKKEKGLQCHLFKTGKKDQITLTELYYSLSCMVARRCHAKKSSLQKK